MVFKGRQENSSHDFRGKRETDVLHAHEGNPSGQEPWDRDVRLPVVALHTQRGLC